MSMHKLFLAVLGVLLMASSVQATVVTGNINNWGFDGDAPVLPSLEIGDGTNHVTFSWGLSPFGFWDSNVWFYGSSNQGGNQGGFPFKSDVAFTHSGVTNISQIADASILDFTIGAVVTNFDTVVGHFFVARNILTGHYGVLRIDDIQDQTWNDGFVDHWQRTLNGTWWFQTDGTGDFSSVSSVPEPSTYMLFGIGLLVLLGYRVRQRN